MALLTPTFQTYLGDQYYGEANWEDVLADIIYCIMFILVVIVYSLYLEKKDAWRLVLGSLLDNIVFLLIALFLFAF